MNKPVNTPVALGILRSSSTRKREIVRPCFSSINREPEMSQMEGAEDRKGVWPGQDSQSFMGNKVLN